MRCSYERKSTIELNAYQNEAMKTAIYPVATAIEYTALGLVSEAGEVAGKVKKMIRDNDGILTEEFRKALMDEYSDVLWYVSEGARALGYSLDAVAAHNLNKLADRQKRGVLQGSGDSR